MRVTKLILFKKYQKPYRVNIYTISKGLLVWGLEQFLSTNWDELLHAE
jgi:hypothetical protein